MAIKSLEDLRKIKAQAKEHTEARKLNERQIIIGMGTCGIAAGAREVMKAVLEELATRRRRDIHDVAVLQTGCIGMCQKEPLLDVVRPGEDRVTYGPVKPTDVPRIIADHLINGVVVEDLVVATDPEQAGVTGRREETYYGSRKSACTGHAPERAASPLVRGR